MLKHKDHFHGSDLEKIEEIYHIKKEDITSFSANVNPLGISPLLRDTLSTHIDAITNYPDRDYTKLRKSICDYTCPVSYTHLDVYKRQIFSRFSWFCRFFLCSYHVGYYRGKSSKSALLLRQMSLCRF